MEEKRGELQGPEEESRARPVFPRPHLLSASTRKTAVWIRRRSDVGCESCHLQFQLQKEPKELEHDLLITSQEWWPQAALVLVTFLLL